MPRVSVTLTERQHADLLWNVMHSGLPAGSARMIDRAVRNGDGTRTLGLDSAVARMLVSGLEPTAKTRTALNALDLAFYAAGDTQPRNQSEAA